LTKFVSKLDLPFNFIDLKLEILDIIEKVGFYNKQIMCQGLSVNSDDWHTGVGRIDELEDSTEKNYIHLNSSLKGTNLEKLVKHYSCFRTRIMQMSPRTCYSVHKDPTPRLHLPIITNSQNWMIWPEHNACHRMIIGDLYWANTTELHTFVNASDEWRIHLVMGTTEFYN
jgi:hypothetical protein